MDALAEWEEPGTGKRIFRALWTPEELYKGRRVDQAPDIFFDLLPGYHAVSLGFGRPTWKVRGMGQHAPCGIFVGRGDMFGSGQCDEMNITDVLPTVLKGMSVPPPDEMDGRPADHVLQ
jgi:predicted AlkP superfamily phosphohydrolase/phosphomutase